MEEQKYLDSETQEIVTKKTHENGTISIRFRDGRVRDLEKWDDARFIELTLLDPEAPAGEVPTEVPVTPV